MANGSMRILQWYLITLYWGIFLHERSIIQQCTNIRNKVPTTAKTGTQPRKALLQMIQEQDQQLPVFRVDPVWLGVLDTEMWKHAIRKCAEWSCNLSSPTVFNP